MGLNGIASCENTFAIFREWFVICDICDLWMLVWLPQEIQEISNNFLLVLVQWHIFFSIYGLSDGWLEKVSFLPLNMTYFPILGKNISHTYSIIITEFPQNKITHILRYFNDPPWFHFI